MWVPANCNISHLLITKYNNKDWCNRHYRGEPGLSNISSIFFLDLLLTSASSVDRPKLFISPSTPFNCVFLGCPSYSFYHNCCTTFDPISVTAMIYTSFHTISVHPSLSSNIPTPIPSILCAHKLISLLTAAVFSANFRYMLSPVRLPVVCNAHAPYSGGCNFREYFYGIWYPGHPLTSMENFTEIIPVEPLRRWS